MIFDLVKDFTVVLEAMPDKHPRRRTLKLLDEAIRRDAHFIDRHPTTVFQCLWNTCWWYDCPDAAKHYARPKLSWRTIQDLFRHKDSLSQRLTNWKERKEVDLPDLRWMRSLRPPRLHLGTALHAILRHASEIRSVAVSGDGQLIASSSGWLISDDTSVRIWNAQTGQEIYRLREPGGIVDCLAFSPDNRRLVTGFRNGRLVDWNLSTLEANVRDVQFLDGHSKSVTSVGFLTNGRVATASEDGSIRIWDLTTGASEFGIWDGRPVACMSLSGDGKRVASAPVRSERASTIRIWDAASGQQLGEIDAHPTRVCSLAFSPDGRLIAAGLADGSIKAWDANTLEELVTLDRHDGPVSSVSFSPDGAHLASGSADSSIRLWRVDSRKEIQRMEGHEKAVVSVAYTDNGRRIVSGSADATVRVWNVGDAEPMRPLRESCEGTCIAFHPSSHEVVTADAFAVAVSPDGKWIVKVLGSDLTVCRSDTGKPVCRLIGHDSGASSIAFAQNGRRMATGHGGEAIVWDADNWRMLHLLEVGSDDLTSVALTPDGERLACGSYDGTITVIDVESETQTWESRKRVFSEIDRLARLTTSFVVSLAFSRDGSRVVSSTMDRQTVVWNAENGERIRSIDGLSDAAQMADIGSSRRLLALARHDEIVFIDSESGRELAYLPQSVERLVGSQDGQCWAGRTAGHLCVFRLEG